MAKRDTQREERRGRDNEVNKQACVLALMKTQRTVENCIILIIIQIIIMCCGRSSLLAINIFIAYKLHN